MADQPATSSTARPLRPLLPANAARRRNPPPSPPPPAFPGSSRSRAVPAACNTCRKQKVKCPGERPACHRCVQKRIPCHYTTNPGETKSQALKRSYHELQNQETRYKELFDLLKNLPEPEAQEVLQRVRSGADIGAILNHIKAGGILVQMAVLPETRLRYEFPYHLEFLEIDVPNNPYLDSIIYEAASLYPEAHNDTRSAGKAPQSAASMAPGQYQNAYLKPFHAAEVVEPRLSDVRCSLWTTVSTDDALMRDLLAVFFRCEYQFTSAFHKDYFLEDLAAHREDFCSSLLVNVLLAYCCVCYHKFPQRAEYWNPDTLLYRFLAEARRIWELESRLPRITTIQAGIIFNVIYNLSGLDEVGQVYRTHAIVLANQMRIFDRESMGHGGERTRNGRAFTAWALYNWETLTAFSFMLHPLLTKPPAWPLPDPARDMYWYGEIWLKYPLSTTLSPSSFGHIFRSRSLFRIIMNDFCQAAHSSSQGLSLDEANLLHARLQRWFNALPGPLQPRAIVLPGHLQLHTYYYHLIISIFDPLLQAVTNQKPTPQEIVTESRKYLQTLVRLYYLRHGFDAMDLFIVIPLMLAASESVEAIDDKTPSGHLENLRSILILAAKGLYDQRRNHYLARALFRVIRARMRQSEVALLKHAVYVNDDEIDAHQDLVQTVRSHWPVSVVKNKEDLDSHVLKNLVDSYTRMNLEQLPDDHDSGIQGATWQTDGQIGRLNQE